MSGFGPSLQENQTFSRNEGHLQAIWDIGEEHTTFVRSCPYLCGSVTSGSNIPPKYFHRSHHFLGGGEGIIWADFPAFLVLFFGFAWRFRFGCETM